MNFEELYKHMPDGLKEYLDTFKKVDQDTQWHPEGNTYNHIVKVVNNASVYDDIDLTLAALCHDLGKDRTTEFVDGRIRSPGHELYSLQVVDLYSDWIKTMGGNLRIIRNIVKYHMRIKFKEQMTKNELGMLERSDFYDKLLKFAECDKMT
jgi:hypothetical protein